MMKTLSLLLTLVAVSLFSIGCDQPTNTGPSTGTPDTHSEDDSDDPHAGHDHAAADHAAPHGGHLIELGRNHEYHAEMVDDHKTESITIYIMDGDMKPLSISETSVNLVLTAGDETQTFELLATQPGGSAEFNSNDAKLMGVIDSGDVKGKLRVTIDGKPFSGSFDHHAHGHEEGDDSHAGHNH